MKPPVFHARNGSTYRFAGGKWFRALGAHEVGPEDPGWFERPRRPTPPTYRDVPTHAHTRPGKAALWFLALAIAARGCIGCHVDRTHEIEARVAGGDLGPAP